MLQRLDRFRINRIIFALLLLIAPWRRQKLERWYSDNSATYDQWQQWAQAYIDLHT